MTLPLRAVRREKTASGRPTAAISPTRANAPLDQINAGNFDKLQIAWRFKTENLGPRPEFISNRRR
jgi:hypothetical protein